MNYNSNFEHDLSIGQLGEKGLGQLLDNSKIEVKTDLKASDTGNVFIEYESRKKPSGISTTKADWYAFILSKENIIIIKTSKLKMICREYLFSYRDIEGGDNNTSKGILLPITELVEL